MRTFVRTGADGQEREAFAYSPADAVNLKARGWVEKVVAAEREPTRPSVDAVSDKSEPAPRRRHKSEE